jgi:hypothetical protein
MWSTLKDEEIAGKLATNGTAVRDALTSLAQLATTRAGSSSDNTSAAALRWLGE